MKTLLLSCVAVLAVLYTLSIVVVEADALATRPARLFKRVQMFGCLTSQ